MLSDLTLSADFITNRIITIKPSMRKRKWDDIDDILKEESDFSRNRITLSEESVRPDHMGFVDDLSRVSVFSNDAHNECSKLNLETSGFVYSRSTSCNDQSHIYDPFGNTGHDDRRELSTPVTDMPILNDNYMYNTMNDSDLLMQSHDHHAYNLELSSLPADGKRSTPTYSTTSSHGGSSYSALNQQPLNSDISVQSLLWFDQLDVREKQYSPLMYPLHNTPYTNTAHNAAPRSSGCMELDGCKNDDRVFLDVTTSEQYTSSTNLGEDDSMDTSNNIGLTQDLADTMPAAHNMTKNTMVNIDTGRRDRLNGKFRHITDVANNTVNNNNSTNADKRCKVCGDRAVNHNFGQLTCESCKAFFRRNAHKELTCTSKAGEHDITPNTRRECPACRLKKCFAVGMRPDLIQVRKKDGSKPRWLDKVPSAAVVHEKHMQTCETNGKTNWSTTNNPKFNKLQDPQQQHAPLQTRQMSRDFREDVCSTDSGSCLSVETNGGGGGLSTISSSSFDEQSKIIAGKHPKISSGLGSRQQSQRMREAFDSTCGHLSPCTTDHVLYETPHCNRNPVGPSTTLTATACGQLSNTDIKSGSIAPPTSVLIHNQSKPDSMEVDQMPGYVPELNTVQEQSNFLTCAVNTHSEPIGSIDTLGDFILVANTPQLIVPTNVVTINTATSIPANHGPVDNLIFNTTPHAQVGMPQMTLSPSSVIRPHIQYATATYTNFSPIQSLSANNVALENSKTMVNHPLLAPLWSPSNPHSTNGGLMQFENGSKAEEPFIANCMLTTSLQPLPQPIPSTLVIQASPLSTNNSIGTSSFGLATDLSSVHSNIIATTNNPSTFVPATNFVVRSPTTQFTCIPSHNLTNTATLLTVSQHTTSSATTSTLQFTGTQATTTAQIPTSPTDIGYHADWSAGGHNHSQLSPIKIITSPPINDSETAIITPTVNNLSNPTPTTSLLTPPTLIAASDFVCSTVPNISTTQLRWPLLTNEKRTGQNQNDDVLLIPNCHVTYYGSDAQTENTLLQVNDPNLSSFSHINLEQIKQAWSLMWAEGEWSNPHNIDLELSDIGSMPVLHWCTTITNLWNDLLFRRIAVFAVSLLAPFLSSWNLNDATVERDRRDYSTPCSTDMLHNTTDIVKGSSADAHMNRAEAAFKIHWEDLIWLAKNRFSDCVPVLLINAVRQDSKHKFVADPSAFWLCSKIDHLSNETISTQRRTTMYCAPTESTIAQFRCNPGGDFAINLNNLETALSQLKLNTTNQNTEPDYPILQYLVAYITQFGSFLACEPELLGTFLSLKLTDPLSLTESKQICDVSRKQRISALHTRLLHVFSEAVDDIARRAHLSDPNYNNLEAANSRREMLSVFLAWSRQFDTGWHRFQQDCWNKMLLSQNSKLMKFAFGLRLLHEPDEVISNLLSSTLDGLMM